MELPEDVAGIISRVNASEEEWKSLYMGVWGCANFYLKPKYENTENWDKKILFELPASLEKYQEYTPKQLYELLTSKDPTITLAHLQTMFSLLEELARETGLIVCNVEKDIMNFDVLEEFLLGKGDYSTFKIGVTKEECIELKLAKKTRDCFIHHGGKVDSHKNGFLSAYGHARKESPNVKAGDDISKAFTNLFHQVEEWHYLMIDIVSKIEDSILKI